MSSGAPEARASITIRREEAEDIQDRWIRIFIDDLPEEILRYGDVLTRDVPAGHHRVRAHNTLSSDTIEFDAAPGQNVCIRCHNTLAKGGILMMLAIGFAFIKVRLEIAAVAPTPCGSSA